MLKRKFSDAMLAMIREELAIFSARCIGLQTVSVSTKDGLLLADHPAGGVTNRLAVMAGTMHSLGTSITGASSLAGCMNVAIEASNGFMVLLAVPGPNEDLVLTAVASSHTSLGMLLCFGRECCTSISDRWSKDDSYVVLLRSRTRKDAHGSGTTRASVRR